MGQGTDKGKKRKERRSYHDRDPGDDKIEGLDAEVLLNTDALEDSEPVMLDFEGQREMPSLPPPPSHNLCTPPTLQPSPPVSAQLSTSAIDPVQQLVQVLLTIGQNTAAPPPPHPPKNNPNLLPPPRTIKGPHPACPQSFFIPWPNHFQNKLQTLTTKNNKTFFPP